MFVNLGKLVKPYEHLNLFMWGNSSLYNIFFSVDLINPMEDSYFKNKNHKIIIKIIK